MCSCGYHPSIATDKGNVFQPEARKCPVCAGSTQEDRFQHERDEQWAKANPNAPARTPRPADGRRMYMRMLSPDEAESLTGGMNRPRPAQP